MTHAMTGYIMTLVTYFDTCNCSFIDLTFVWPWVQLKAGLEPPCQWMSFCKIWPSTCISFQVKSKMIIAIIFIYQFHLSTVCEMLCIGKLKLHVKSSHFRINLRFPSPRYMSKFLKTSSVQGRRFVLISQDCFTQNYIRQKSYCVEICPMGLSF